MIRKAGIDGFNLAIRLLVALALAAMASCGGSGGGDSGPEPPPPPSALSYASPQIFAVGTAITPLNPSVTGTVSSYTVTPALPDGLTLDVTSGQVSGTPTALTATADYTITAHNDSGEAAFLLSLTIAGVDVLPGTISRMVVGGTSIAANVSILPQNFTVSGALFAGAADADGVFGPAVDVTAEPGGGYTLSFATSSTVASGHYAGRLTLALCTDSACNARQPVPSASVDYEIDVMSPSTEWLGNNLTTLEAWDGVADWTTFQGNSAHTGHVPVDVDPNQFSTRWKIRALALSANFYQNLSTIAASDGQFFVAGENKIYARSEFDGRAVWSHNFTGLLQYPSVNPPAVSDGVVYMAAGQQDSTYLYAFNAGDGSLVFRSPMSSQWEHYLAPTVGENGVYTNAGTYGGLYAFDRTGIQLYFAFMDQTSAWTPAVDSSGVYGYTGGVLQVADPVSGAILTSINDPNFVNYTYEIGGSPVLGAPGSVFVANYVNSLLNDGAIGNSLINFDVAGGDIAWRKAGDYASTPAYADGVVYAANELPLGLEARTEADGALLWSWTPPQAGDEDFESEVLLTDNLAFVSTNLATYAIDLDTHLTVWSYPQTGRLALSRSGILYLQGTEALTAINVK
jgi:hypothetical protein